MATDAVHVVRVGPHAISFAGDEPVFADDSTKQALEEAAQLIRQGQLVAFPTETVYGLGANALDDAAVKRIYAAKQRPADNPLIVHVSSRSMLMSLLEGEEPAYAQLMERFWPGPLSLLFPLSSAAKSRPAATATAGLSTFVARMPDNPVARGLIALAGVPIAAPSANTSGRPSPTTAEHVAADMRAAHGSEGSWPTLRILDGGPCGVGVESTVVDGISAEGKLRILRLGGLGPDAIQAAAGLPCELPTAAPTEAPRTPGQKYRHYAPNARVVLLDVVHDADALHISELFSQQSGSIGLLQPDPSRLAFIPPHVHLATLGMSTEDHARHLFAGLRELELLGAQTIFVEQPAGEAWRSGVGLTVAERLGKAAKGDGTMPEVIRVRA